MAFGERHHADRKRNPPANLRQRRASSARLPTTEPDQLGRAAADVEQDDAFGRGVDQRCAAGGGEQRLGLAIGDLEIEPDDFAHPLEELAAVDGRTTGLGRDQPRAGDAAVVHLVAADRERFKRAANRHRAQPAGDG